MQTDTLKTVLEYGMKATSKMTDCMTDHLPEETREKVKSTRLSLLKAIHEITGDMLRQDQSSEESAEPNQTSIVIE